MAGAVARAARGGNGGGSSLFLPDSTGPAPVPAPGFYDRLRYVGQVHRTYLVCEAPGELVLVDQHAAHERVTYSRLRKAHAAHAVARQALLHPLELEVDPSLHALAESAEGAALLSRLGFEVDTFGKSGARDCLLVRAVPHLLRDADVGALVRDALGALGDEPAVTAADAQVDHLLATMACHGSRRAGDVLPREEVEALLGSLDEVDLASHCPHGRPVLVRLSLGELERRFGRA